jgi:hypothetical protein
MTRAKLALPDGQHRSIWETSQTDSGDDPAPRGVHHGVDDEHRNAAVWSCEAKQASSRSVLGARGKGGNRRLRRYGFPRVARARSIAAAAAENPARRASSSDVHAPS